MARQYNLTTQRLGAIVKGIDLKEEVPPAIVKQIRDHVTKHRLLIFKDQGVVPAQRQVEISRWFGELESTFYKHPRSPHPDVFRVSNDEREGCRGVGRTGWHIDGSFQRAPFSYSLYHIVNAPRKGATVFAPLTELLQGLSPEKRARWERLWMVSDRRMGVVHPHIYPHPITSKATMCFHIGMTECFVWDYEESNARVTSAEETAEILAEIHEEFVKDNCAIQYVHNWETGDFIISDNLAVAHEAHPTTQQPASEVGLRVMHRTTIRGSVPPIECRRGKLDCSS
uniref:3-((Z)-2-isocyanoethenyl)-1H-indole synthase-like n=1 Tax=Myxine glutinosa TaxID=7769 RepID=UPI00358F0BE8